MVNALAGLMDGANIAQQFQDTYDRSRLNMLSGKAYSAPQAERQSLLGNMASIDPRAAQAQQQQWQADEDRQTKMLVNGARYMKSAMDRNDPQAVQGAWNTVLPMLVRNGIVKEGELDKNWDPSYAPSVHQLLAMGGMEPAGGSNGNKVVGNALVDPDGNIIYQAERQPEYMWSDRAGAWIPNPNNANLPGKPVEAGGTIYTTSTGEKLDVSQVTDPHMRQQILSNPGQYGLIPDGGSVVADASTAGAQQGGALAPVRVPGVGPRQEGAPSGYTWDASGSGLMPIPGGPADRKANPLPADQAAGEMGMRKELSSQLKDARSVLSMYQNVKSAANSGSAAGDLSLIFAFMKMLDPGSVVREQEFSNAQNAAGIPDRILNYRNQVMSGQRLNPKQREQFLAEAAQLANAAQQTITSSTREYQGIADQYGYDPARATGMADFRDVSGATSTTQGQQPARPMTERDFNALPQGALYVDPDDGRTYRKR